MARLYVLDAEGFVVSGRREFSAETTGYLDIGVVDLGSFEKAPKCPVNEISFDVRKHFRGNYRINLYNK